MMTRDIKWGIVGLGNIAHQFCEDLSLVEQATIYAVASRSKEKSEAFAKKYGAIKNYDSYDALFKDPDVDIVYIATPHDSHAELSIAAMNHGKHVLCEKPLAVNSVQVKSMIEASKANKVYLMEAFWTRFNPSIVEIKEKIAQGVIGDIVHIKADFSFPQNLEDEHGRNLNMALAGGALLDMGPYPVFLAYLLLGIPNDIKASAQFHETGADIQTSAVFNYDDAQAMLYTGFCHESDMIARIYGTKGEIHIDRIWHEAQGYSIIKEGEKVDFSKPTIGKGFAHEIISCQDHLMSNARENKLWALSDSLNVIGLLDKIRTSIGLKYPFE